MYGIYVRFPSSRTEWLERPVLKWYASALGTGSGCADPVRRAELASSIEFYPIVPPLYNMAEAICTI